MAEKPEATLHRNAALLEFDSAETAAEMLAASGLEPFVVRRLTPCVFLVDPLKAEELRGRFEELGYTPNLLGGET